MYFPNKNLTDLFISSANDNFLFFNFRERERMCLSLLDYAQFPLGSTKLETSKTAYQENRRNLLKLK